MIMTTLKLNDFGSFFIDKLNFNLYKNEKSKHEENASAGLNLLDRLKFRSLAFTLINLFI
jgi:hypothetical protein